MSDDLKLEEGVFLKDNSQRGKGRIIRLKQRVNPQGKEIDPYWVVRNTTTGKTTTIREDRLVSPRWSVDE